MYVKLPTSASSGSSFGSTPNSNAALPIPPAPIPSSPWIIGEEIRASDKCGPGGTVTRWLPVPSLPFNAFTKAVNTSLLTLSSPKLMTSTFTFSFFKRFANFTSSFSSISIGLPINATIRILWFLPCRCFRANCKFYKSCYKFSRYLHEICTYMSNPDACNKS